MESGNVWSDITPDIAAASSDESGNVTHTRLKMRRSMRSISTRAVSADWNIVSGIDRAEQDYRLMLRYAFSAVADPERDRLYGSAT